MPVCRYGTEKEKIDWGEPKQSHSARREKRKQRQPDNAPAWKSSWDRPAPREQAVQQSRRNTQALPEATVLIGAEQAVENNEVLSGVKVDLELAKRAARVLAIREARQRYIDSDHKPKVEWDPQRAYRGW
jgi:hypothetical protein